MKLITNRTITLLVSLSIVFGSFGIVSAQEVTETPEPEVTEVLESPVDESPAIDADEFVEQFREIFPADSLLGQFANPLLFALALVVFTPAVIGLTTPITSILKRIPLFANIPSPMIALSVGLVLWSLFTISAYFGYEDRAFEIISAVTMAGYTLLVGNTSLIGASKLYESSARNNVPVIGYSRHVAEYQRNANQANG